MRTKATTLARRLLERALIERAGDGGREVDAVKEVRADLQTLIRAHYNATLKLLRQSGMSAEEVTAWAKKRLK